jgi:hypothetical protein
LNQPIQPEFLHEKKTEEWLNAEYSPLAEENSPGIHPRILREFIFFAALRKLSALTVKLKKKL